MSLLDELKQQAEAKKEQERAEQRRQAEAAEAFRAEVRPRLTQAATYLAELAEHLSFVQPDIRVDYPLKAYGTLEGLRQSNYRATTDGGEDIRSVTLSFSCVGERPLHFDVQGEALMARETDFLREARLEYSRREHRGERRNITGASFKVEPKVPVIIRLEIAADMLNVVLTVSNLDALETRRYPLDYQKLDSDFLDELGKAVLRQENSFLRLDISPEERKRLRKQLDRVGRKRAKEQPAVPGAVTARAEVSGAGIPRAEDSAAKAAPPPAPAEASKPDRPARTAPARDQGQGAPRGPRDIRVEFARAPSASAPPGPEGAGVQAQIDEQLEHIADLQRTPMQLLDAAGWILSSLNRLALTRPGERLRYSESILAQAHGALARFYGEFVRGAGGLPEDEYRREALSRCVNVARQLVASYAQAFAEDYPRAPGDYEKARARLVLAGVRLLELSRLEQRFSALRYQRMPADAWQDCNRVLFLLDAHGDAEQALPLGCDVGFPPRAGASRHHRPAATALDLYLSLQLFGFLDLTMWPVQLFHLPDAYLEGTRARVRMLADDGQALAPGRLFATLADTGPAQVTRPPKVSAPAVELDYSELFTQALRDRMELEKMNFIGEFERARVSRTIAEVPELDRMAGLDLLLHGLTRRERGQTRRAVLDDQRLHVHFGFNECYRMLRRHHAHARGGSSTQARAEGEARGPGQDAGHWNLVNFSTGGLLIGTRQAELPRPARIGDLVVFAPVDNTHWPLIGYIARLQHPSERQAQAAIVRLSRYAEAAAIQSSESDRLFEQPAILVQDVKNQWRIVLPPDYGFVSGAPLKLIRPDGRGAPARLGDVRLTRPEFVVFDVRSPGLESEPVEPGPAGE